MLDTAVKDHFQPINRGYNQVFQPQRLSLGLVVPLTAYPHSPVPVMEAQVERIQLAEALGFAAVWLRDVPFEVPAFGDAGQVYDPFVYLGSLAHATDSIALGVASIVLPLRHPAHVAKAAASVDVLSGGRLILGVASGDRPEEYPALNSAFEQRGTRFREAFEYIQQMWQHRPVFDNAWGRLQGQADLLPKPVAGRFPMLITGGSQQSPDWRARHGDGWMLYPRDPGLQGQIINQWRQQVAAAGKPPQPTMQPLYLDLADDPDAPLRPIHLGYHTGVRQLKQHLSQLQQQGVNHVALNLRFNQQDINTTLHTLAEEVLPTFSQTTETSS